MATDTREAILGRLFDIFDGLKADGSFKTVLRDRGEVEDEFLPACYLLDASETSVFETDTPTSERFQAGKGPGRPALIRLAPEIYVHLPSVLLPNKSRGQALNELRIKLVRAVMLDETLATLVGTNGQLSYQGVQTDLARGQMMRGMMQVFIVATYPFKVSSL